MDYLITGNFYLLSNTNYFWPTLAQMCDRVLIYRYEKVKSAISFDHWHPQLTFEGLLRFPFFEHAG